MTRLCALCGVTPAGYHAWRCRPESAHADQDRRLTQQITTLFHRHHGRYESPRMPHELQTAGCRVSRQRVARLRRTAGLRAGVAPVYRANPRLHRFFDRHPNRLPLQGAHRRDQVWVADITCVPVGRRWYFLAAVVDQHSRRVVAWTLGQRRDTHLTRRVLEAAVHRRRFSRGLIFHSDRGREYCAASLRERLAW